MDDAEQIDEQRDAVENWQRPQTRFQRILRLEDEAVNQHVKTDAHRSAHHRRDEPRTDDRS